jgi:hypothetical protein
LGERRRIEPLRTERPRPRVLVPSPRIGGGRRERVDAAVMLKIQRQNAANITGQ